MSRMTMRKIKFLFLFAMLTVAFQNCGYVAKPIDVSLIGTNDGASVDAIPFAKVKAEVFDPKCLACHSDSLQSGNVNLQSYTSTMKAVVAGDADGSLVYQSIADGSMPLGGALDPAAKQLVYDWIRGGALETVSGGNPADGLPIVNAGGDRALILPSNSITLNGTASDPGGLITAIKWTQESGGAAILSNDTTFNLYVSGLQAGSYQFKLTVTDDEGNSSSSTMTLTVQAAGVPTPTPRPATPTPTPRPGTPTPRPATPTPRPATPTPRPATPTPNPGGAVTFSSLKTTFLDAKCAACHQSATYNVVKGWGERFYTRTADKSMPLGGSGLPDTQIQMIRRWIDGGSPNN